MKATAILEKLDELGIKVELDGTDIICEPSSKIPAELRPEIREHKSQIIALLHGRTYRLHFAKGTDPDIEYQELVRQVEEEGIVLLWSRTLKDFIAIFDMEADRSKVPAGFIPYSDKEVRILFSDDKPEGSLRRIHDAKRSGADITGAWQEANGSLEVTLLSLQKGSEWLRKQHAALYVDPKSVDLDIYTKGLDKWDSLEKTLRFAQGYTDCIFGSGKRCPEGSQPTCQTCACS